MKILYGFLIVGSLSYSLIASDSFSSLQDRINGIETNNVLTSKILENLSASDRQKSNELKNLKNKIESLSKELHDLKQSMGSPESKVVSTQVLENKKKKEFTEDLSSESSQNSSPIFSTNLTGTYYVTHWEVAVRKAPTSNGTYIKSVYIGEKVNVIEILDNGWVNTDIGYIYGSLLSPAPDKKINLSVSYDSANIRNKPFDSEDTFVRKASKKEILQAITTVLNGNWYLLDNGEFIWKEAVKVVKESGVK